MGREKKIKIDWISNSLEGDFISLTNYVEKNSLLIRSEYINIIDSLECLKKSNKLIKSYYKCLDDYDLLDMSLLSEKSFYKSPEINDVIKLIGLDKLISKLNPETVVLKNLPKKVKKTINEYCVNKKIKFFTISNREDNKKKKFYKYLPYPIQAILWFLLKYFDFLRSDNKKLKSIYTNKNSLFAIGYFTHIDIDRLYRGEFYSGMWGRFTEACKLKNLKINFLHHYIPNKHTVSQAIGNSQLNILNKSNFNSHSFISNHSSHKIFFKIFKIYLSKILFQKNQKKIIYDHFRNLSNFNLIQIIEESIESSLRGIVLMENLYYIVHFDEIFKNLENQKLGFYLMENQSWEFALVNAWKKYLHGRLYAIQHSTVSFWDLRYNNPFLNKKFKPDKFLVNGDAAMQHFMDFNYPSNDTYLIEAIRYLKLELNNTNPSGDNKLVFGDIISNNTNKMLSLVKPIAKNDIINNWYFKSHPANEIKVDFKNDGLIETNDSIYKLFKKSKTVICPSSSGVALEAYLAGLKVIVFNQPGEINTSPLFKIEGVCFVSNTSQIEDALNKKNNFKKKLNFFDLDSKLGKLNQLLYL